jgi:hypothetical protein
MADMKLRMGRWNNYLIVEDMAKLKKDPATTVNFLTKLSKVKDKKELQAVLATLLSDPQVKAAATLVKNLTQNTGTPPQSQQEGVIEDFELATIGAGQDLANNPTFQKLVKYGGPLIALGMIVAPLVSHGTFDPEMVRGAMQVAKASTNANVESGFELAFGVADLASTLPGKRDVEERF